MSRTTDTLVKALDSPSSLTPAERSFCGGGNLHAEALAGGRPCDCPACAPELYQVEEPVKPPHQSDLFPVPPTPNPGAYGPGRTKGVYFDVRCEVCGVPWASHPEDCPRHAYRPNQEPTPR